MTWLFATGHAVDIVIAVMLAECGLLLAAKRSAPSVIALTFVPGLLILLGLRAALVGADWPFVALPLALSFPAHLADLRSRCLIGLGRRSRADATPTAERAKTTTSGSTSDRR